MTSTQLWDFLTSFPLCPQYLRISCLSAKLWYFLTPPLFCADVIHGSPLSSFLYHGRGVLLKARNVDGYVHLDWLQVIVPPLKTKAAGAGWNGLSTSCLGIKLYSVFIFHTLRIRTEPVSCASKECAVLPLYLGSTCSMSDQTQLPIHMLEEILLLYHAGARDIRPITAWGPSSRPKRGVGGWKGYTDKAEISLHFWPL